MKTYIFKKGLNLLTLMINDLPILKRMLEMVYTLALVILISGIVGMVLAFPVQWLWNFVFGSILTINVFQAWALNVLMGILFGNKTATNGRK